MKNINRPQYDVNQIASFITENLDEINMPGAQQVNSQTGQGLGSSEQYHGDFGYDFKEFEKDGALYSGTLVVDTDVEKDYDDDGGETYAVVYKDFKGINDFKRQDIETGEVTDINTNTPEGQDLMEKVGMTIIHEKPPHASTENRFGLALRNSREGYNDRSPEDYRD